ncbi:hypothetical protein K458DRAFT_42813 [Lentithecium fluviatile CBS 122367]|uniref:Uncharacterized protein n=1 Tax=Lentithecium fluviatile CBS 122367 TaxID=1168545 RepID=A0A6G1J0S8_9PLEO|nr:hypothetical protein K458DRAFT_42813 [Lentithecium fluviatile CBS 122367]
MVANNLHAERIADVVDLFLESGISLPMTVRWTGCSKSMMHVVCSPPHVDDAFKHNRRLQEVKLMFKAAARIICTLALYDVSIDAKDDFGRTAYHYAVAAGYVTPGPLLQEKPDVNCQDLEGMTPLHIAIAFNDSSLAIQSERPSQHHE